MTNRIRDILMGSSLSTAHNSTNPNSFCSDSNEGSKMFTEISACCSCQSDVPRRYIHASQNRKSTSSGQADTKLQPSSSDISEPGITQNDSPASSSSNGRFSVYQAPSPSKLFPGWTQIDKDHLEYAIEQIPRQFSVRLCRKGNPDFMDWMEKIARKVPGKTADDCAACYLDMLSNRIAFFGLTPRQNNAKTGK